MLHSENNGCLSFGVCVRAAATTPLVGRHIAMHEPNWCKMYSYKRHNRCCPFEIRGSCTTSTHTHTRFKCSSIENSIVNTLQRRTATLLWECTHVRISHLEYCAVPHLNAKLLSTFNFMRYITLNLSDSFVVRSLRQTVPCVFGFSLSRSSFQLLCHSFDLVWLRALVCVCVWCHSNPTSTVDS